MATFFIIISVLLSVFAIITTIFVYMNKKKQVLSQLQFFRKGHILWGILGIIIIILGFYYGGVYGLKISVPSFLWGLFFIFFSRVKIQISYMGIFNGLFYIQWKDISSYRWNRSRRGTLMIKTKFSDPLNFWQHKFHLHVPKKMIHKVDGILKRNRN